MGFIVVVDMYIRKQLIAIVYHHPHTHTQIGLRTFLSHMEIR